MAGTDSKTIRLQVTIDKSTDELLEEIAELGLMGAKKTDVARDIISDWVKHRWIADGFGEQLRKEAERKRK